MGSHESRCGLWPGRGKNLCFHQFGKRFKQSRSSVKPLTTYETHLPCLVIDTGSLRAKLVEPIEAPTLVAISVTFMILLTFQ